MKGAIQRLVCKIDSQAAKAGIVGVLLTSLFVHGGRGVFAETFVETLKKAIAYEKSGDYDAAIATYQMGKGMAGKPLNDASLGLARLYRKLNRFADAEVEYETLIVPTELSSPLRLELAQLYSEQGKFSQAQPLFQNIVNQNPNDYVAVYGLAVCMEATESADSAKDYYNRVIELAPGSAHAQRAEQLLSRAEEAVDSHRTQQYFPIEPEMGSIGLGWWNLKKMPIHIYIDQGDTTNYRSSMRNHVINALDAWRQASGGRINFVIDPPEPQNELAFKKGTAGKLPFSLKEEKDFPKDTKRTGIHFHWTDYMPGALGLAWTNVYGNHESDKEDDRTHEITYGHIWLNTNCLPDGRRLPSKETAANASLFQAQDRMLAEVSVHELGHALGLTHSSRSKDIMCAGIYAMNSRDMVQSRGLSPGDLMSLTQHYNSFTGTGMPEKVELQAEDGTVRIYHDVAQSGRSARVPNMAPLRMTSAYIGITSPTATLSGPSNRSASDKFAEVLFDIESKNYQAGTAKIGAILAKEPNNAMAVYLRGVLKVNLHNYKEAAADYQTVLKLVPGSALAQKASQGLLKLKH